MLNINPFFLKDCGDLGLSSLLLFFNRAKDNNENWPEVFRQYKADRAACNETLALAPSEVLTYQACLCSADLKYKKWTCAGQLLKAERYLIETAYVMLSKFKNAFSFHKQVRQFCDD